MIYVGREGYEGRLGIRYIRNRVRLLPDDEEINWNRFWGFWREHIFCERPILVDMQPTRNAIFRLGANPPKS